jgi:hypothetical protein
VRGLALDQELLDAMPVEHSGTAAFDAQRDQLVRVLAQALAGQAVASPPRSSTFRR